MSEIKPTTLLVNPDFRPRYEQLSQEQSKLLFMIIMADAEKMPPPPEHEYDLLMQILKKRIDVLELPVQLDGWALAALTLIATNPGRAVVALIDCLDKFEGKVTVEDITMRLYPMGFYDEESLTYIVDNIHKKNLAKWSGIYGSR